MIVDDQEKTYQAKKKRCCQTAAVGLVMSDPRTRRIMPGPVRRLLGLSILAAAHLFTLCWGLLVSIFVPRYRPVVRFHYRYFRDVMARELFGDKSPAADGP